MAESPLYVNVVKRKEGLGKSRKPRVYKNIGRLPHEKAEECDREGYQIVHERGLDPNGEYTDLTPKISSDQASDATLQREKMINDMLFPQKDAPRRFNYTDIQLLTPMNNDEEQLPFDVCDTPSVQAKEHCIVRKPITKPKRNIFKKSHSEESHSEDKVSVDLAEEEDDVQATVDEETATVDEKAVPDRLRACSWNTYCSKIVYTLLLMVCICISVVAVAVATVAFVKPSRVCERAFLHEECGIAAGDGGTVFPDNNCTTPAIAVMTKEVSEMRVAKATRIEILYD